MAEGAREGDERKRRGEVGKSTTVNREIFARVCTRAHKNGRLDYKSV